MGLLIDDSQTPSGLLGQGLYDPRSAALLNLAAGMMQGNTGAGLANAGKAFQDAATANLQRADMAQQIGLRNIQLQQAQQEWNLMMRPALEAYARRMAGQPTTDGNAPGASQSAAPGANPAASGQPAIAPTSGGPLGSGTFGIPTGGQSSAAPQSQPQGQALQQSDPFSDPINLIQSRLAERIGGAPAASAYWDRFKLPDAVKTNNYYGIPNAAVQDSMLRDMASKGQLQVRNSGTITRTNPDGTITPLFTAPDVHSNTFVTWQNGSPVAASIPGAAQAQGDLARARAAGEGSVLPFSGKDANGNPLPTTNRTAAATQGGAPVITPQPASASTQPADSDRAAIYQGEIAKTQDMIANPGKYMSPNDRMSDPDGSKFVARAKGDLAALQREASAVGVKPAAPAGGPIYSEAPLGAVPNADASQKASAESMKDSYTKLQANGATANAALDALDKMMTLAANKNPVFTAGVLGTNQAAINPDAAEYEKQRANVISLLAQQGGTNGTDAGRALTGESVPDFGKPKAAIADGLGTLRNQVMVQQIKRSFLTPIYQAGDSKKYTTLENQFDQNVSPNLIPLLTMPSGPQRAAALKAAAADPTMKARLNWAAENGLLK